VSVKCCWRQASIQFLLCVTTVVLRKGGISMVMNIHILPSHTHLSFRGYIVTQATGHACQQLLQCGTIVFAAAPRHQSESQRQLFQLIVLSDEGVDREQLRMQFMHYFKSAIHVPAGISVCIIFVILNTS